MLVQRVLIDAAHLVDHDVSTDAFHEFSVLVLHRYTAHSPYELHHVTVTWTWSAYSSWRIVGAD